jgi:uncharacterized protein
MSDIISRFYPYKYKKEYWVLDTNNLLFFKIDRKSFNLLNEVNSVDEPAIRNEIDLILNRLSAFSNKASIVDMDHINNIAYTEASVSIAPTYNCNMCCSYCYASEKSGVQDFDKDKIPAIVDAVYNNLFIKCDKINFSFIGGEPLLRLDIIQNFIVYAKEQKNNTGRDFSISICTNSTIYNKKIEKFLLKHQVSLSISLDGYKQVHDSYRKFNTTRGSYDTILHNIQILVKNNINLTALVVVTNKTDNFVKIIRNHKKLGFQGIRIKLIRTDDDSYRIDDMLLRKNIEEVYSFLKSEFIDGSIEYLLFILNYSDIIGSYIMRLIIGQPTVALCNAGLNKIAITDQMKIYPCASLAGYEVYNIGIVNSGFDNSIFYNNTINKIKGCKDCWIRHMCGGNSCHHNIYINGTVNCKINKFIAEKAFDFIVFMLNTDISLYQSIYKQVSY